MVGQSLTRRAIIDTDEFKVYYLGKGSGVVNSGMLHSN